MWQMYWKNWWQLWPYYNRTIYTYDETRKDATKYAVSIFCFGPLQMRWYS